MLDPGLAMMHQADSLVGPHVRDGQVARVYLIRNPDKPASLLPDG